MFKPLMIFCSVFPRVPYALDFLYAEPAEWHQLGFMTGGCLSKGPRPPVVVTLYSSTCEARWTKLGSGFGFLKAVRPHGIQIGIISGTRKLTKSLNVVVSMPGILRRQPRWTVGL